MLQCRLHDGAYETPKHAPINNTLSLTCSNVSFTMEHKKLYSMPHQLKRRGTCGLTLRGNAVAGAEARACAFSESRVFRTSSNSSRNPLSASESETESGETGLLPESETESGETGLPQARIPNKYEPLRSSTWTGRLTLDECNLARNCLC